MARRHKGDMLALVPDPVLLTSPICFTEEYPDTPLWRSALVEALGTLLLTLAIAGSTLMARHNALDSASARILNAVATASALASLIVALGPVSGGHFNPLIKVLQWLKDGRSGICTLACWAGQLAGALAGSQIANLFSSYERQRLSILGSIPWSQVPSEIFSSAALMLVVFACFRAGNRTTAPFAVGAWLIAAVLATPSRSIANPAISAAMIVSSAAGTGSLLGTGLLVAAEGAGALIALALLTLLIPRSPAVASSRFRHTLRDSVSG
jgi:glycerol uptake facilitator-like aquaporin